VRLENHHQIFIWPACTRSFNGGIHLGGVVTIVVNQHGAARFAVYLLQRERAEEVEAASGTLEALQRPQDRLIVNPLFRGYGNGRRRVQGVMAARWVQRDL